MRAHRLGIRGVGVGGGVGGSVETGVGGSGVQRLRGVRGLETGLAGRRARSGADDLLSG